MGKGIEWCLALECRIALRQAGIIGGYLSLSNLATEKWFLIVVNGGSCLCAFRRRWKYFSLVGGPVGSDRLKEMSLEIGISEKRERYWRS